MDLAPAVAVVGSVADNRRGGALAGRKPSRRRNERGAGGSSSTRIIRVSGDRLRRPGQMHANKFEVSTVTSRACQSTVTDVTCRLPCSACAPSVCEPRVIARGRRTAPSLARGGRRSRLRLRSKTCIVRTPPHAADKPQRTKTCILRMPPHALRLCGRGKGCGLDAEQYRPPLCQSGCTTGEDPARLRLVGTNATRAVSK